jgi:hypothetical protein
VPPSLNCIANWCFPSTLCFLSKDGPLAFRLKKTDLSRLRGRSGEQHRWQIKSCKLRVWRNRLSNRRRPSLSKTQIKENCCHQSSKPPGRPVSIRPNSRRMDLCKWAAVPAHSAFHHCLSVGRADDETTDRHL